MEDQPQKKGSKLVTAALVAVAIGMLVVGCAVAETQIPAYKAGYILGSILVYAALGTIVLGGILKSVHMPHPWAASSCVISLLSAIVLIWQSHLQARSDDQLTEALAIERSLIFQFADDDPITMAEYPKSAYGTFSTPLTIVNRELMNFQRRKLDLEAKQKTVGLLGLDSPDTFTDAGKRADALKKIAIQEEINSQSMKNAHDFLDTLRADVEASDMSAGDKQDFLAGFGKRAQGFVDQVDSYCKLALEIDGLSSDMLDIAATDKPRMVKGHLIFSSDVDSKRFQDDAEKIATAADNLKAMRKAMGQDVAPYLSK